MKGQGSSTSRRRRLLSSNLHAWCLCFAASYTNGSPRPLSGSRSVKQAAVVLRKRVVPPRGRRSASRHLEANHDFERRRRRYSRGRFLGLRRVPSHPTSHHRQRSLHQPPSKPGLSVDDVDTLNAYSPRRLAKCLWFPSDQCAWSCSRQSADGQLGKIPNRGSASFRHCSGL